MLLKFNAQVDFRIDFWPHTNTLPSSQEADTSIHKAGVGKFMHSLESLPVLSYHPLMPSHPTAAPCGYLSLQQESMLSSSMPQYWIS